MSKTNYHEEALKAMKSWAEQGTGLEDLIVKVNAYLGAKESKFANKSDQPELNAYLEYMERWGNCCISISLLLYKGLSAEECYRLCTVLKDIAFKGNKTMESNLMNMIQKLDQANDEQPVS